MQFTLARSSTCASPAGVRNQLEFSVQHGDGTTSSMIFDTAAASLSLGGRVGDAYEVTFEPAANAHDRRARAAALCAGPLSKLVHAEPRFVEDPEGAALNLLGMIDAIVRSPRGQELVAAFKGYFGDSHPEQTAAKPDPLPIRRRR